MFSKNVFKSMSQNHNPGKPPTTGAGKPILIAGVALVAAAGAALVFSPKKTTNPENSSAVVENNAVPTQAAGAGEMVKLNMWDQEEAENTKILDEWIQKFEAANPNIDITRQTYKPEELRTQFTLAATGGEGADMVWGPNDIGGVFAAANLISPVEDKIDVAKFSKIATEAVIVNGKMIGVPISIGNHLMLLFNKSIIKEAPKTTDELLKVAKANTVPAEGKFGFAFYQSEPFFVAPFIGGYGSWPLTTEPGAAPKITLDTPGMKQALTFVRDLKFTHKVVPNECDYDCAKALFLEGKTPMTINGDWSVKEFRQKMGVNLGIAPLPVVSETNLPMAPMVSGRYIFVNSKVDAKKSEAVNKFLTYLTSKEIQLEVASKLGRIPATTEAAQDPAVTSNVELNEIISTTVNGKPMPPQLEMRAAWDGMRPVLQKVMAGQVQPEEATALMQQGALETLASLRDNKPAK